MDRRFNWTTLSLALAAIVLFSIEVNAQSTGCNDGGDAGCSGGCNFGYPAAQSDCGGGCDGAAVGRGGCESGGCGIGGHGHGDKLKAHYRHITEINRRAYERNRAWPKPFDCADRQLYFSIWEPMLTHGYQLNCVFNDSHFDSETNQLNDSGKSKISGIFRNNPVGQKVAFIQNSGTTHVVESRVQNLQATVDQWYGSDSFAEIAATNEFPGVFSASRVEGLQKLSASQLAAPVIPVASGTGSTSDISQ